MGEDKPKYVIIRDLWRTLSDRYGVREAREDAELKAALKALEARFVEEFGSVVPDEMKLTSVSMKSVIKDIGAMIGDLREKSPQLTVISLDPFLAKHGEVALDMTRRFNPEEGTMQLMQRSGYPTVDTQVANLLGFLSDGKRPNKVAIADVSSFTGNTITAIVSLLEQHGVEVEAVVLGISSHEVLRKLAEAHRDKVKVHVAQFAHHAIELRDLVGIDGKEVPNGNNHRSFVPLTEHPKWAEITPENAGTFVRLSDAYNTEILKELSRRGIDIGKIGESTPLREKHRRLLVH